MAETQVSEGQGEKSASPSQPPASVATDPLAFRSNIRLALCQLDCTESLSAEALDAIAYKMLAVFAEAHAVPAGELAELRAEVARLKKHQRRDAEDWAATDDLLIAAGAPADISGHDAKIDWLRAEIERLKAHQAAGGMLGGVMPSQPATDPPADFIAFWHAHSEWSQATFGTDQERGPVGSLKHLAKEVQEVLADPTDIIEFADLLFLVFDSTRRAGFTPEQLIEAANAKLAVNKSRQWQKPTSDEPVEHVRATDPPRSER